MGIKTVRTLRLVLILVALAFCLLGRLVNRAAPGLAIVCLVLCVATLIADIVITFVFYKCPWCKRLLPTRGVVAKYCPYCGAPLDD